MTDTPIAPNSAIDSVLSDYSAAELAVAEIAAALKRFKSAGEQLEDARSATTDATAALNAATAVTEALATSVDGVAKAVLKTADAVTAIDPERLWRHLEATERQRSADNSEAGMRLETFRIEAAARDQVLLRVAAVAAGASTIGVLLLALIATRVIAL